jgi:hypothetical protein
MAAAVANAGAERSGSLVALGRTSGTVTVTGRDGPGSFTDLASQLKCMHRLLILISAIFFLGVRAYCFLLTFQVHYRSFAELGFFAKGEADFGLDYLAYSPTC